MEIGIQSGDLRLVGNDVQANATAFSRAVVGTDASVRAFNNKGVAKYGFSNELETLVHVVIRRYNGLPIGNHWHILFAYDDLTVRVTFWVRIAVGVVVCCICVVRFTHLHCLHEWIDDKGSI